MADRDGRTQIEYSRKAESLLLAGFSVLLAVALAELCLPAFNATTGKHLRLLAGAAGKRYRPS